MSENAQVAEKTSPDADGKTIRASALFGPMAHFERERPEKTAQIFARLDEAFVGSMGEGQVGADPYLEGLARLEAGVSDPGFAIRAALSQDFGQIGLLGQGIIHAETLWDALVSAREGISYYQSETTIRFGLRMDRFRIEYIHNFGESAEAALDVQYSISLFLNLICQVKHYRDANIFVRFPRCQPGFHSYIPWAERVSKASRGTIEFDSFLLRQRLRHSDPGLSATISSAMKSLEDEEAETPSISALTLQLQKAALREMHAPLSLKKIADILATPTRTIQHDLQKGGTSFAAVRDGARHRLAKKELQAGRSVSETAHLLGYAQYQSFTEAFSRWEGASPSEFGSRGHSGRN